MNWKSYLLLSCIVTACQTSSEVNSPNPYASGEHPLEREEVIPLEQPDQIISESNDFSITKDQSAQPEENIFEKIRFRKMNVTKNIRETVLPLQTVEIYPVDKKSNSDVIHKVNLKLNNLLQKWFDLNYAKLSEYVPSHQMAHPDTLNEIQINFVAKNKVQIEISSPLEGMQSLSEEIPLTD